MDYNLIYESSKSLLQDHADYKSNIKFKDYTDESFKLEMIDKYIYLNTTVKSIFDLCLSGKMDLKILSYMISQIKNIKTNNISKHDASVNVGEKLVDTFIKPKLNNHKN